MFSNRKKYIGLFLVVFIWILVLAIPKTRLLLGAQFAEVFHSFQEVGFPTSAEITRLHTLAKERPNDAKVQAFLIQSEVLHKRTHTYEFVKRLPEFDALIRRFPNKSWLWLDRMRASTAGSFSTPKGSYLLGGKGKPHDLFHGKSWLTAAQRKKMLQMALKGEHRDPNNSFYNWIEAMCWYDLGHSDKALQTLYRGSLKSGYNDGLLQDARNRLYVQQLLGPALLEDRWLAIASTPMPQLAIMRTVNRVAVWQGAMLEKAGKHSQALKVYGAQMRLIALLNKKSTFMIGRSVVNPMLLINWMAFTRWQPGGLSTFYAGSQSEINNKITTAAQRFAHYAKSHNRADLANQALSLASGITQDPLRNTHFRTAYPMLSQSQLQQVALLKWSGMRLLKILLGSLILWAILSGLLLALKKIDIPQLPLTCNDSVLGVLLALVCVITGTVFLLAPVSDKTHLYLLMLSPPFFGGSNPKAIIDALKALLTWLPRVLLALLFTWCLLASFWKMRKSTFSDEVSTLTRKINSVLLFVAKLIVWIVLLLFQVVWAVALWHEVIYSFQSVLMGYYFAFLIPLPLILVALFLYWRKRRSRPARQLPAATYCLSVGKMLHHSLAILIVICSVAYAATSFAALPIRHHANADLNQFVQIGEVAWLRKHIDQLDKTPRRIE